MRRAKRKVGDEEIEERADNVAKRARTSRRPSPHHVLTSEGRRGCKRKASGEADHGRVMKRSPSSLNTSCKASSKPSAATASSDRTSVFKAKYEEECVLGEGGYGEVYAGYRKHDNLPVAIKHIDLSNVTWSPVCVSGQQQVPLEVALLSMVGPGSESVGSSAAVSLIDFFELERELILIMERPVPSVNLLMYTRFMGSSGFLQENNAKVLMKQLLAAFIDIHSKGVFHRDIKPENILVQTGSDGPRIRVIDFGCGDVLKLESYSDCKGTLDYLPPEYFRCHRYEAGPTTVWQLGILLFFMLHGVFPFRNRREITHMSPKFSLKLPKYCRRFLVSCLAKNPSCRPTLEDLLNHCWLKRSSFPNAEVT
ncbi:serine/threonine-protein kinase pim-2-like [Genypterus blacodes]|uniref:serine/threonine-protein kinase pim-2-like n=1 Tax=Genypterus blacodes TaxID=154954 RepID=UPI003F766A04